VVNVRSATEEPWSFCDRSSATVVGEASDGGIQFFVLIGFLASSSMWTVRGFRPGLCWVGHLGVRFHDWGKVSWKDVTPARGIRLISALGLPRAICRRGRKRGSFHRETALSTLGVAIGFFEIWYFRQQTALKDIPRQLFISGMIFRECMEREWSR